MRRFLACALGLLLSHTAYAVDLTGDWFICADCRVDGFCHPFGGPQPETDGWTITQTGTSLSIVTTQFGSTFSGTIDPATGAFVVPRPQNAIEFTGVGTFSTIDGRYDSSFQWGTIFGGRRCDPLAPACNDGDACTNDACQPAVVGTCTETPVAVCVNAPNGSCPTTTSTSTTTSTTTTSLPPEHYPVTGSKLVLKRNANGRQTLIFVTRDPGAFVPAFGGPDDPTTVPIQIDLYTPTESSPLFDLVVPPGVGKPGWTTRPVPPTYTFTNSFAPEGISKVRSVKIRQGKGLKIVARATGLSMTTPLGAVGIAVRFDELSAGLPVLCAHFGAASVRKDVPPIFMAGPSPPPVNCHAFFLRMP
jgi:hypothetical protein